MTKDNLADLRQILKGTAVSGGPASQRIESVPEIADLPQELRSPMAQLAARVEELELLPAFIAGELRSLV